MVWATPKMSNVTRPLSMSAVYTGGGLYCIEFGSVGKRALPPAEMRSAMPVPYTNEPTIEARFPRSLACTAGMMGANRSTDTPQPVVWFEACAGGGVNAFSLNWRLTPDTESESGAAMVTAAPRVVIPFQLLTARRSPGVAKAGHGVGDHRIALHRPRRLEGDVEGDRPARAERARQPELRGARRDLVGNAQQRGHGVEVLEPEHVERVAGQDVDVGIAQRQVRVPDAERRAVVVGVLGDRRSDLRAGDHVGRAGLVAAEVTLEHRRRRDARDLR